MTKEPFVVLKNVAKRWNGQLGVEEISLDIYEGSFTALLGPSGCGKSTTLRLLAGLELADEGKILIDGKDVTTSAASDRKLSMVFQSYALFPHLSVAENIVFGLKVRRVRKAERQQKLHRALEITGLLGYEARKPGELSGGQRQRVALARAIVAGQRLCLMDEPLSNLDAKLRHDMRAEFKRLHRELGMTMLLATPDQLEALTMGERVGVMRDGKVVTIGTPRDLYQKPQDTYVAEMVGSPPINFLPATGTGDNQVSLPFLSQPVAAPGVKQGQPVTLGLRPHDIALANGGSLPDTRFTGKIHLTEPLGDVTVLDVAAQDTIIKMVLREEVASKLSVGEEIEIAFDPKDLHVFDQSTGTRLNNGVGE